MSGGKNRNHQKIRARVPEDVLEEAGVFEEYERDPEDDGQDIYQVLRKVCGAPPVNRMRLKTVH